MRYRESALAPEHSVRAKFYLTFVAIGEAHAAIQVAADRFCRAAGAVMKAKEKASKTPTLTVVEELLSAELAEQTASDLLTAVKEDLSLAYVAHGVARKAAGLRS